MIQNNKAQTGIISIVFYVIVFIIFWVMAFGKLIAYWGHQAVINGGMTGIEAFMYDNINLMILIVLFIFILAIGVIGRTQ
jgi:hypothetical protein